MKKLKYLTLILFISNSVFGQESPIVKLGDTTKFYTENKDLATISFYDKTGILIYSKVYWQDLPNGKYVFVSKKGFVTVRDGVSVTLDSSTPDNITEIAVDNNNNEVTYIWKNGKREIYTGGRADNVRETKYEGDNPGVYEWHDGKLKFLRKLNKEDLEEKERADKQNEEILKMMNLQLDTTANRDSKITEANVRDYIFTIRIKLYTQDADSTSGIIKITKNGNFFKKINSDGNRYPIELDLNSNYLFKCSKKGYNTKVVYIDTSVPAGREKEEFANFIIDVELQKKVKGEKIDSSIPIGGVEYIPTEGDFNAVKKLTEIY